MSLPDLSIVNGLVFDGRSAEPAEFPVHVAGGRIVGLEGPPPDGARVLDAAGRVVIPGLIDCHFHAYGIGLDLLELEAQPLSYVVAKASVRLRRALRRGFTTVRDVAGGDIGLQTALREGVLAGPRYFFTGRALTQTGGHADPRPGHLHLETTCGCGHMGEIVDGEDNLRRAVRERLRTGSHAIKIFTSGGVVSPTDPIRMPQYSEGEVRAVVDEASRRQSYVASHAYSPEAIGHAVRGGVRTIEHGNLLDEDSARLMAESGAFLVPTLIAYDAMQRRGSDLGLPEVSRVKNEEVLEAGLDSLAIARAAGVKIGLGTDLMGDLEDDQLLEFRVRSQAEGPAAILRSATSVNAAIIGRSDLGVVREGAVADLVILDGDPWQDPSLLWSPRRTVIQGGGPVGDGR